MNNPLSYIQEKRIEKNTIKCAQRFAAFQKNLTERFLLQMEHSMKHNLQDDRNQFDPDMILRTAIAGAYNQVNSFALESAQSMAVDVLEDANYHDLAALVTEYQRKE